MVQLEESSQRRSVFLSLSLSLEGVTLKLDGLDDALFDHNMN